MCDGENLIFDNDNDGKQLNNFFRNLFNCNLIRLKYVLSPHSDHCGASAAVIGLEMIRLYKRKMLDTEEIGPSSERLKKIEGRLHQYQSRSKTGWKPIDKVEKPRCREPGCDYRNFNRKSLLNHERSHQRT